MQMKICSTVDLRDKEVINLCDGARLGCAQDFEIDVSCGRILALVIAGDCGIFGFSKREDIIIPWEKVECIGEDTVLVKLEPNELQICVHEHKKKGKKAKF